MWSSHSQFTVTLNRHILDGITDMKNMTSLQVSKRPCNIDWREEEKYRYANGLGILELDGKRYESKTERRIELSQHESCWVQTIIGYLCVHPTFPYRIKKKVVIIRLKNAVKKHPPFPLPVILLT
jgi:hypothetical protein